MQTSSSKKTDLQRDFVAGVYLSEAKNPIPLLPLHIVYVYIVYLFAQGRGGGGREGREDPERRLKG